MQSHKATLDLPRSVCGQGFPPWSVCESKVPDARLFWECDPQTSPVVSLPCALTYYLDAIVVSGRGHQLPLGLRCSCRHPRAPANEQLEVDSSNTADHVDLHDCFWYILEWEQDQPSTISTVWQCVVNVIGNLQLGSYSLMHVIKILCFFL